MFCFARRECRRGTSLGSASLTRCSTLPPREQVGVNKDLKESRYATVYPFSSVSPALHRRGQSAGSHDDQPGVRVSPLESDLVMKERRASSECEMAAFCEI